MSLTAGTRLGPYEIVAPLGAGGMGEVMRNADFAEPTAPSIDDRVQADLMHVGYSLRVGFERRERIRGRC
jgi:hypothetical protein